MKHPLVGSSAHRPQRALVVGAGMAGLLAARVLLDHFAHVAVIGRCSAVDARPPGHVLAVQGFRTLERLFPGLAAELALAGAPSVDWTADCPALLPAGWAARFRSGLVTRTISGAGLAQTVRRRLIEYGGDRLSLVESARAVGLLWENDRVSGVRLAHDGAPEAATLTTACADFVVDASGRASQAAAWLAYAGFDAPVESSASAPAVYVRGVFRRPGSADPNWRALLIVPVPGRIGALLHPLENQRWVVTVDLPPGVNPPADLDALLALLHSLPTPAIHDALCAAEPLEPVRVYAHPGSRALAYHRLARWPDGFTVTGEAACALDPAYGHGLTAAVLAAQALDSGLAEQRRVYPDGALDSLGQRLQSAQAAAHAAPVRAAVAFAAWRTGNASALAGRCADALLAAAAATPAAYRALLETFTLTRPPSALLRPAAALRALRPAPPLAAPGPIPPDPGAQRSTQELAALS